MTFPRPPAANFAGVLLVLLGNLCLWGAILGFGWWALPIIGVGAIGVVALYRLEWALYAVIFLLPFTAIGGMSEGYNVIVQAFKRVLLSALLGAWVVQVLYRRSRIYAPPALLTAILVFMSAAAASVLRAPQPMVAATSTARLFLYCGVYVILTINVLDRPERIWRAVQVLLVSATLTAGFALYQLAGYYLGWRTFLNPSYTTVYMIPRVHSVMTEPLHLSNYLLMVFPIALALFVWRERTWPRLTYCAAVATTAGILVAASRAGWGVFALITGIIPLVARRHMLKRRLVWPAVAVGAVVMVAVLTVWVERFGSLGELAGYIGRFATFAGDDAGSGDLSGRLQNLGLLSHVLETSPVIGIGTNNVGFEFHEFMTIAGPKISSSGNTYLDTMIETGLVGLLALATIIGVGLSAGWQGYRARPKDREGALLLGVGVGLLGSAIHINFYGSLTWAAHTFFAIGLAVAARRALVPGVSPVEPAKPGIGSRAPCRLGDRRAQAADVVIPNRKVLL